MAGIIVIVPEHIKTNTELLREIDVYAGGPSQKKELFYHNAKNTGELKKLFINNEFDRVVIGYVSFIDDIVWIQMIKSLSPDSAMTMYCPDLSFIRNVKDMKDENEITSWYMNGKILQCNMYRQADIVIVRTEEEKELLKHEVGAAAVLTVREAQENDVHAVAKKKKKVSIIMLTFNQFKLTKQCIESLEKYTSYPYELVIVDNGSTDGTKEYLGGLMKVKKDLQVVFNDTNLGFSKANNQGIMKASGDYILLLNNDVILTDKWLDRMVACAESDPRVGVVGPCTNKAVGQQLVPVDLHFDYIIIQDDSMIQKLASMHLMKYAADWYETHRIIGFCMLIKRAVVESIGILDERFGPGGFEDFDYCLRVKQAGYKVMIAGDVFIYHIGGQGYVNNMMDYDALRQQNVQIFIDKWCRKAMEIMEQFP